MFLVGMRHETVTVPAAAGLDFKAIGYLTSIVSVLFLGAVAWAKENPPDWYYPVLVIGMATSIIGMGFRYRAHLQEQREIKRAEAKAKRR
jgi:O-antigen/teichoic acid export membrane protein